MRVQLDGVTKRFGRVTAVENLTLDIPSGSLVALLGPSGCGKSTTLYLLAGVLRPTAGMIRFDGKVVNDVLPQHRNIGMVFQSYALYPHMTVYDNIAFPLRMQKKSEEEIRRLVHEYAELVQVAHLLDRRPGELSGGQQQRVALARALVKKPALLLLDEPLSNLDAQLRLAMRAEIRRIQREVGITAVLVTHDQTEAMTIADRVVVMDAGRIVAEGTPQELYRTPPNRFTAAFIGHPPMNWLTGRADGQRLYLEGMAAAVPLAATIPAGAYDVGVRPHHVQVVGPGQGHADGTVDLVELLGHEKLVTVTTEGGSTLRVLMEGETPVAEGDRVGLRLVPEGVHVFRRDDGRRVTHGIGVTDAPLLQ
ncbi:MAG: ABC transporter ATP-binding protein [Calditerricola sp.]|jgi:ABC-type sugar transport systems, ATPase components|nr:ABC transporter ATP-binding protein [Calditerricola sp.]